MTIINEFKSRPANPRQHDTSERIGKPFMYVFFSMTAAVTGVVLTTIHANRIYQCMPFFWNEVALAVGISLIVAGLFSMIAVIYLVASFEVPEIIEERQYQQPQPEPARLVRHTVHSSHAPGLLEISKRGQNTCGVFFPHKIMAMVNSFGVWPSRKQFWAKPSVWAGTKESAWHADLYQRNTDMLVEGGILERRGNGFELTENGKKFFEIDPPAS